MELTEAVASGSIGATRTILDNGADINASGSNGITPLCCASLWGNESMAKFLLENGANVNATNEGTGWTALLAASFQEHGKIVLLLLSRGADPELSDHEGRTAVDYASISESIWPFFSAHGCTRTSKIELIAKKIIQKVISNQSQEMISSMSRPGSAYVRVDQNPFQPSSRQQQKKQPQAPIDPLGKKQAAKVSLRRASFNRGSI